MNLHRFSILLTWISCQQIWVVYGCSSKCTSIDPGTNGFECNGKTINVCKTFSPSWKVYRLNWDQLHLSDCKKGPQAGDQLLLFVSSGKLVNYGKYEIVTVKLVTSTRDKKGVGLCHVTLEKPIDMFLVKDQHTCLIAQIFPYFGKVSLRNKCVLTCKGQKDGLGGILAFRAKNLSIDQTSKVDMSGKGFRGGAGGERRGGGGLGSETFFCPAKEPNMGKGGDISGASWAKNTNGIGGGGGGDGPAQRKGPT